MTIIEGLFDNRYESQINGKNNGVKHNYCVKIIKRKRKYLFVSVEMKICTVEIMTKIMMVLQYLFFPKKKKQKKTELL